MFPSSAHRGNHNSRDSKGIGELLLLQRLSNQECQAKTIYLALCKLVFGFFIRTIL